MSADEINKAAELVRAVTASLEGPQVIWLLTTKSRDSWSSNTYYYSSESIARQRWKDMLNDEEEEWGHEEPDVLKAAIEKIDFGMYEVEFHENDFSLESYTLDQ